MAKELWDLQETIAQFHQAVMATNAFALGFFLIYKRSLFFNLKFWKTQVHWSLRVGFLVLPFYYLFESYTTYYFCVSALLFSCKFIIHHILTVSLCLMINHYNYYNFFILLTTVTHGLMNVGYYQFKPMQYFMCRWYFGSSVCAAVYTGLLLFLRPEARKMSLSILFIGLLLIINNAKTPELVSLCTPDEEVNVSSSAELVFHGLMLSFLVLGVKKYTKKETLSNTKEVVSV
mmetsp:Transcript_1280/g.2036  ORF Transcript_1280/g.2036 Transcript_1280/m.2036 type:complete len:232 (-) Transcript_1280:210-905(-)